LSSPLPCEYIIRPPAQKACKLLAVSFESGRFIKLLNLFNVRNQLTARADEVIE